MKFKRFIIELKSPVMSGEYASDYKRLMKMHDKIKTGKWREKNPTELRPFELMKGYRELSELKSAIEDFFGRYTGRGDKRKALAIVKDGGRHLEDGKYKIKEKDSRAAAIKLDWALEKLHTAINIIE